MTADRAALGFGSHVRMNGALLFSLLVHGVLLSLTFGGVGMPGLNLPWQEPDYRASDLRVVLTQPPPDLPAPRPRAEPMPVNAPRDRPAEMPSEPPPFSGPSVIAVDRAAAWVVPAASAVTSTPVAALSSASSAAVETLRPASDTLKPREPRALASELAPLEARALAVMSSASAPPVESVRREALRSRENRETLERLAPLDSDLREVQQPVVVAVLGSSASAAAVEAPRRPDASLRPRDLSLRDPTLNASRDDVMQGVQRLEAARAEALRQEAARAEAARQETARQDSARAEAARQEVARAEAARQAAGRQELARLEAARQEGIRLESARLAAAQALAQAEAEQREARKRAIGRQLDEEAARRDAQRDNERQRPDWAPARRGRLFGRTDANAELTAYGEAWGRKIENNLSPEQVREVTRQASGDAVITVSVRSNGSVESITVVRSSGVAAVDDAITRIVRSQENYPAFPPALLRDFDVVEIRRTWHFDTALRLY
ncbi:MAG: TonB family protein [Rubrivivax sp.]|nr:MAG: TonB family protein [Rubrivivax sp.]